MMQNLHNSHSCLLQRFHSSEKMPKKLVKSVTSSHRPLTRPKGSLMPQFNCLRPSLSIERRKLSNKERNFSTHLMKLTNTSKDSKRLMLRASASVSLWKIKCATRYNACNRTHNINNKVSPHSSRLLQCHLGLVVYPQVVS